MWERVSAQQKDSLFMKELLMCIWDKEDLRERSLQGKQCPRFPDRAPKTPLTPWKVNVMRECYKARLERSGVPKSLLPAAVKNLNHFIVEKLADLEKVVKRAAKDSAAY
ncbi:BEN domain-containing protein 5-like [Ornithodoros turicata]|uniref:BEN domain-containing protein 5-like n=1 Tax=Ornithodoros turicata TaxID=34597 RepID=UPI003139EC49